MVLAAMYIVFFQNEHFDVILSDSISASLPVFRWFSKAKSVFYCHFPDKLLTKREGTAKVLYRKIIDAIEEYTTGKADVICVNSHFTKGVVRQTFPSLASKELTVLYPSLNTEFFDAIEVSDDIGEEIPSLAKFIFTSLNRFERKKNVKLALDAFAQLKSLVTPSEFAQCHLVIAGGYDLKNPENSEYYTELVHHVDDLNIPSNKVTFLRSPSDERKVNLIRKSRAILYTPDREHFGIVPVESMYLGTPVIAVNSGGPCESVRNNETGYLINQTADAFAAKMKILMENEETYKVLSEEGPRWVQKVFGFEAFVRQLDEIVLTS
uniref:Alpha-1,3/1,6-mannosyltransferase ALG2 n=1 Tax=Caenorhabditis japonica TaxID=281687 RepID=A0A8R1E4K4_CAEJA